MKLQFVKMHGAGNDYIYIDRFAQKIPIDAPALAPRLSDRHFGVGSDGLVLIEPSDAADARMRMFNADGSESEMCGNAIRCVGKYVYETGIAKKETLLIETGKGVLSLRLSFDADGSVHAARVDMGAPELRGRAIPTTIDKTPVLMEPIEIDGERYRFTAISMGNPHAVVYVDNVDAFPVERIGRQIERHPFFPNRTNVEFVEIVNNGEAIQRTWERGAGETLACGTGAAAVCVAGVLNGITNRVLTVRLLGGNLAIEWPEKDASVFMTGNAVETFRGEIEL